MARNYADAIDKINGLQTNASILEALRKAGPRMNSQSLPEMCEYVRRIGYEPSAFNALNIIHVTGTKGKGSTCAFAESILRHHHETTGVRTLRTGLFTSPHLVAVRERIRIDGRPVSEEVFARYFFECLDRLEETKEQYFENSKDRVKDVKGARTHADKPTYFRFLTLLAFHVFMQEKVDVAIMEVGVGGEFDSTNIVERPAATGVASLGLDHVAVLGNTIDSIAWHKAGIFKEGVPAFAVEQPPEAMEVLVRRAEEKKAPLTIISHKDADQFKDIPLGLAGAHQRHNAALATSLCRSWLTQHFPSHTPPTTPTIPTSFLSGLRQVSWPGRGQTLPNSRTKHAVPEGEVDNLTWYLDGAHTTESLQACTEWFRDAVGKKRDEGVERILVFNCTNGRNAQRLLEVVARVQGDVEFDEAVFCTNITFRIGYSSDNVNNMVETDTQLTAQHAFATSWQQLVPGARTHVVRSVEEAVVHAVARAREMRGTGRKVQVLTTGSLILVGNQLAVMGVEPD